MNPICIKIEDFMNHRLSEIDCSQFKSALIVAKNKNNDRESNGIGKTTIYSAIEYALFGEVPTSVVDKVVRDGADKCLVTFDFELGGETYRIKRGRSRSGRSELKIEQWDGVKWEKISGTRIPEAESKIAKLIKLNSKAFAYSIKFGQSDLTGLSEVDKPEKRQKMLKEPLQLTPYTKLEKFVTDLVRPIKKDIERTDAGIQMLGDPEADIKAAESELKYCESTIKSKEATIEKLGKSIVEKDLSIADLKKRLGSNDNDAHDKIAQLRVRLKELKTIISNANERVQKSNRLIDDNTKRCVTVRTNLAELLVFQKNLVAKSFASKDELEKQLQKVANDEIQGVRILATYEAEYDAVNKSLPSGNVCSHCLQSITPEHRERCEKEVASLLEEKSKLIQTTKSNLTKCRNKKSRLEKERNDALQHERAVNSVQQDISTAKAELDIRTKNIEESEDRLADALSEMEKAQSEANDVVENLDRLKDIVKHSTESEINNQILALNDEVRVWKRSLENVRKELSEAQQRQGAAQERNKTANDNLLKIKTEKEKLTKLRKQLKTHQLVINAFSPGGIPTFVIHSVLDELQVEANQWLQKLRPDLEISFNEEVDMFFRVDGAEREHKQLSIGQRVYIALALKLGLSRVIQKKLGIDIRFLLLDEVDQSLDKAGVEAFAEVVRKLQDEFKVFVITHNDDLKDKFSHTILVEGDGKNGATSQVVASW